MWPKLILAVLVGLLFCTLATLETTELLNLADDTSNDFSLIGTQQQASLVAISESGALEPRVVPTTLGCERPRVPRRPAGSSYPANDFLDFLCIMRT